MYFLLIAVHAHHVLPVGQVQRRCTRPARHARAFQLRPAGQVLSCRSATLHAAIIRNTVKSVLNIPELCGVR
jgi:hypothetical protein